MWKWRTRKQNLFPECFLDHPGPKAIATVCKKYTNNSHDKVVKTVLSKFSYCSTCKHRKVKTEKTAGDLNCDSINEVISTDICGPFSIGNADEPESIFIVNFIDSCSIYCEVGVVKNITSVTILEEFKNVWIKKNGTPKKLICEHGSQFIEMIS